MYYCKECKKIVNDKVCFICKSETELVDMLLTKGDKQWQQQTYAH